MRGAHILKRKPHRPLEGSSPLARGALNAVDKSIIDKLIGTKWLNGMNFSERIWGNGKAVADYIMRDVRNAIIRGDNYAKLVKDMRERFTGTSKHNAYRLIYTEGTFIVNESSMQAFIEMGYTHYKYSAVMDEKTCDICGGLHGQVFPIAERMPGFNFPACHPWCRCSFEIVTEDVYNSDMRDDGHIAKPIAARHSATGNPPGVLYYGGELNSKQKELLSLLPREGSEATVRKGEVSMKDLAALTAKTDAEYAMFTRGAQRLVVRGNSMEILALDEARALELKAQGYRLSGHTHTGTQAVDTMPSKGDRFILGCFEQENSVIYLPTGKYEVFSIGVKDGS